MNKKSIYLATALLATLLAASFESIKSGGAQAQSADPQSGQSVQVVVKPVQRKSMAGTLVTYGDVAAGTVKSISSASAASLASLNVTQGASVKKGEVLAVLAGDPMTRLAYEQARTSVTQTTADLERAMQMQAWKLATQAQVDAARKAKTDAEANFAAQRALGGDKEGQVIKAPADGVVLSLTAFQGDRLQAGVPFMQIGTTETLKILLGVDPADLPSVRPGLAVRLVALGSAGEAISARLAEVHPVVDPKTQLASAVVKVPASVQLIPGARVRAEIVLPGQEAFEVPRQAVLTDDNGSYVFQVAGKIAHRVAVSKVVDGGQMLGVSGALDVHRPLVVLGNYELADGMAVRAAQ